MRKPTGHGAIEYEKVPLVAPGHDAGDEAKTKTTIPCLHPPCLHPRLRGVLNGRVLKARNPNGERGEVEAGEEEVKQLNA